MENTIKITGYSSGDSLVGIGRAEFSIDTGLCELSEDDKIYIIHNIIRDLWELHDNGDLIYLFSDDEFNGRSRRMTWEMSNEILSHQRKMRILNALD